MVLSREEIMVLCDHHKDEIRYLKNRIDEVRNSYCLDKDILEMQLDRICEEMRDHEDRISELRSHLNES